MSKIQVVFSHGGSRHVDDTIGVAILMDRRGAIHKTIAPQDVAGIAAARENGALLVDVGSDYNPSLGWFDHHHNEALPCAAVLVAKAEGLDAFLGSPAAVFMTAKDLRGFAAATKETGHNPGPDAAAAEANLVSVKLTKEFSASCVTYLAAMRGDESYREVMLGLWAAAPESAKVEAEATAKAKAEAESKAIAAAGVVEVDGIKVVVGTIAIQAPVAFKAFPGAVMVVCPNAMNGEHLSFVKDTRSEMASRINLAKSAEACGLPQIFVHNAGFIAVVAGKVEDVDLVTFVRGVMT